MVVSSGLGHTGLMASSASTPLIRAWAREQGMAVGDRGRLSPDVLAAFEASALVTQPATGGGETSRRASTTKDFRIASAPLSGATNTSHRVRARV